MIGISKLYLGVSERSDELRYGWRAYPDGAGSESVPKDRKPVVVWNMTARCNLNCRHCYAEAGNSAESQELTISESLRLIDDLADFGAMHKFAQTHPSTLIVTKTDGLRDLAGSKDFSIELLGKQGNFHLIRLCIK